MSEGLDTVVGGGVVDTTRAEASFKMGRDKEAEGDLSLIHI